MKTPEKFGALVQCLYDGNRFLNRRKTCMCPSENKTAIFQFSYLTLCLINDLLTY